MIKVTSCILICVFFVGCSTSRTIHERYPFEAYVSPGSEIEMPNYSIKVPELNKSFKDIEWRQFSDTESIEGLTINVGMGNSYSYVVSVDVGWVDISEGKDVFEYFKEIYEDPSFIKLNENCAIADLKGNYEGQSRYYVYNAACVNRKNNKFYQIVISEKNFLGREPEGQFKEMARTVINSFKGL